MWRLSLTQDVAISALISGFGLLSLVIGGYFIYQTYFRHPRYRYLPVSEEWQTYLHGLIEQVQGSVCEASPSAYLVDISGAVVSPGVYSVSDHSRVQDVILMAGGFSQNASKRFIHQEINLARRVDDQQKIYIPLEGESVYPRMSDMQPSSLTDEELPTGKISLDTATQAQLESLDGVGEKRAASILAGRPYRDEADFLERSGLSRTLAQELLLESISIE